MKKDGEEELHIYTYPPTERERERERERESHETHQRYLERKIRTWNSEPMPPTPRH
jgi:hypothetical protein